MAEETVWGRAVRPHAPINSDSSYTLVHVSDRERFCRNCERTIKVGQPYVRGAGCDLDTACLEAKGWVLFPGAVGAEE